MSAELELARFVLNTKYDDLTKEVVQAAKRDIFDTIGVGLAGASAPGIKEVVSYAKEMGGKKRSTILVYGDKIPPANAALVNGSMCHALDFDDTHDRAVLHTGVCVLPAAFAIAEHIGGVSGKDFINAATLGIEIHCRLGIATKLWIGWMLTPLYGYFGAATAVSKLLGLDEEHLLNAWGIAYSQAAGNTATIASGGLTKRIQAGFSASGGVIAGLLAQKGITGAQNVFEGRAGIFNLYQRGEYDAAALTEALGKRFEVVNLSYKPYPCCRFNHSSIVAALEIAYKYDIKPEQIEEVRVGVNRAGYVNNCEPIEIKRKPRNPVDAQFSVPYAVACALVRKRVDPVDISEELIKDPAVLSVAAKVYPFIDPEIDKQAGREIAPSRVEMRTKDGKVYSAKVDLPKGHAANPMTNEEFEAKFRSCALSSGKDISLKVLDNLIDTLNNLEQVDDIRQVTRLFGLQER